VNSHIIDAFDLWLVKDERQRVFWPSIVRMNDRYFESLQKHAVPLDERALAALSNSPVALDLYAWLAQRLHRISKKQFITRES
jgi:Plasmid encoded RepA protein